MLTSALAYLLAFILGVVLGGLVAVVVKIALIISLVYLLGRALMLRNFIYIAQPIDFITSILYGFLAIWVGRSILFTFEVEVDWFLLIFFAMGIGWFDLARIRQAKRLVNTEVETPNQQWQPSLPASDSELSPDEQKALDDRMKQFMHGNRIIMLIGKLTGLILGGLNLIG